MSKEITREEALKALDSFLNHTITTSTPRQTQTALKKYETIKQYIKALVDTNTSLEDKLQRQASEIDSKNMLINLLEDRLNEYIEKEKENRKTINAISEVVREDTLIDKHGNQLEEEFTNGEDSIKQLIKSILEE